MKKLILIIFGIMILLSFSVVSAVVYDVSNTSNVNISQVDWWYMNTLDDYGLDNILHMYHFADLELNQSNTSDDTRVSIASGVGGSSAYCLNVTINEDPDLVNNITFIAEGYGILDPHNYTQIWVYNESDLWELLRTDQSLEGTDNTTSYVITKDWEDYIHDGDIYFIYSSQGQNSSQPDVDLYVDYLRLIVTVGEAAIESYQNMNDTYPQLGETINFTVTITDDFGLRWIFLSTNETGTWKKWDGLYGSPQNMTNSTINTTSFYWANDSYCDRVVGIRGVYNNSNSTEIYTDINDTFLLPYVNGSTGFRNNISESHCDNSTHINMTWEHVSTGNLQVWLDHVLVAANKTCPYTATNVYNLTMRNLTDFCYVYGTLKDIEDGTVLHVTKGKFISFEAVANIPAAISATAVLAIIVIYVVTRKYKSKGW